MAAPLKNKNCPSRVRLILTSDDLRDLIAWSGESHPTIAARAGMKPWRLSKILNGHVRLTHDVAKRLLIALAESPCAPTPPVSVQQAARQIIEHILADPTHPRHAWVKAAMANL